MIKFDNTMNELYDNDPNLSMHCENNIEVFVTWLCVFIALWQYAFGITDTVIDILIKFSKTFFNLISLHINSFSGIAKTFHHRYIHFINILVMTKMPTRHMFSAWNVLIYTVQKMHRQSLGVLIIRESVTMFCFQTIQINITERNVEKFWCKNLRHLVGKRDYH